MTSSENHDFQFKLVLVGSSGVGKTNLLLRFTDEDFKSSNQLTTIGIDFRIKTMVLGDTVIKLQVWDPAGQEKFRTVINTFYRGTHGVILIYDITSKKSLEEIDNWLLDIEKFGNPDLRMILVGNKCDLEEKREVSFEEGKAYADHLGIKYMETSAKDLRNVIEAFTNLVSEIKEKMDPRSIEFRQDGLNRRLTKAVSINQYPSRSCC